MLIEEKEETILWKNQNIPSVQVESTATLENN